MAQGIAARAMYAGKKILVKKGILPGTHPAGFQRAQVMEAVVSNQWRIGLPNGVSVAFAGEVDARTLTTVLSSAADALKLRKIDRVADWSLARILYELEGYNGWGYRKFHQHVKSPYLWSFSNHYTQGKYIADGTWSDTAVSGQGGAAVLIKRLEQRGEISILTGQIAAAMSFHCGTRTVSLTEAKICSAF